MASTPPPAPPAPSAAPPPVPGKKKVSPWVWVAVGCGGLILVAALVLAILTFWVFKKGKEFVSGAEKNPAVAAAKVAAALDPDIEVVDADDEAGTVTIRNRKTGEVITLDAKDIQKGRIAFSDEKGKKVRIESSEKEGGVRFSSEEGEVLFGSSVSLPAWVPVPAGTKLEGGLAASGKRGKGGAAGFKTAMTASEVLAFYERELKGSGFSPTVSKFEQDGRVLGGLVQGKHVDGRSVLVTVSREDDLTHVALTYEEGQP